LPREIEGDERVEESLDDPSVVGRKLPGPSVQPSGEPGVDALGVAEEDDQLMMMMMTTMMYS
jgi:hypothetical protein